MPEKEKKDPTRNQRQARRREREKLWLKDNGWQSWEALHTAIMNGAVHLASGTVDGQRALEDQQIPGENSGL
jgi:hypothetical protein